LFELMRGDRVRAAPNAFKLVRLAREHDLPMWGAFGAFLDGWASAASTAIGSGLENMRRGAELARRQNILVFDGLLKIAPRRKPRRAIPTAPSASSTRRWRRPTARAIARS
jgi:hypothetical protein